MIKKIVALSCLLILSAFLLSAGETVDTAAVDKIFKKWDKPGSPGCALAVIRDGKIVYKQGYGYANLELNVPITPESVFYIGSVSKQFVAFSIALLEARGKLKFDDDIRKYIPEMPDYGVKITLRHLIHHTSGIRDYLMLTDLAGLDLNYFHKASEVIKTLVSRQKTLTFKPGKKFKYSNSGYLMLAEIVKRVSGKSFRKFVKKNIFTPLEMNNSRFHDNYTELIKNRASSYFPAGRSRYINFISTFDLVGSGGLYTTVEDLYLWDRNFYHHKVGGREIFEILHNRGKLNDGEILDYAFGIVHGNYKGLKTIAHSGALGGYRSVLLRFPDQKFSVIILSNYAGFNPMVDARKVADIFLAQSYKPESKTRFDIKSGKSERNIWIIKWVHTEIKKVARW